MKEVSTVRRSIASGLSKLDFSVPVHVIREANHFVAYSPTLDLATHGTSLQDALDAHKRAAVLFFRELEEMGTTEEVLMSLGWTKRQMSPARRGRRPVWKLVPPEVVGTLTERITI